MSTLRKQIKDMLPGDGGYIVKSAIFFDKYNNPYLNKLSKLIDQPWSVDTHIKLEKNEYGEYICDFESASDYHNKIIYSINKYNSHNMIPLTPEARTAMNIAIGKSQSKRQFDYEFENKNLEMQVEAALENYAKAIQIRDYLNK